MLGSGGEGDKEPQRRRRRVSLHATCAFSFASKAPPCSAFQEDSAKGGGASRVGIHKRIAAGTRPAIDAFKQDTSFRTR